MTPRLRRRLRLSRRLAIGPVHEERGLPGTVAEVGRPAVAGLSDPSAS
jgi:hypothetical protein